jgi:hypothetical protein
LEFFFPGLIFFIDKMSDSCVPSNDLM